MVGGGGPVRSVPAVTSIRIGCGAGYSGDRIEPAVELAEDGRLDYLVFECLAERTIALAQLRKSPRPGHRLRSAAGRADAGRAAGLRQARRDDRHQHGRGQPDRGGGGRPRRRARARAARPAGGGGDRRRRARRDRAGRRHRSPRRARRSSASATRSSRPTPTSARTRSSRRWRAGARRGHDRPRRRSVAVRGAACRHAFGWAADDWALVGRAHRSSDICSSAPAR